MKYIVAIFIIVCHLCYGEILERANAQNISHSEIITHISVNGNEIFVGDGNGGVAIYTLENTNKTRLLKAFKLPHIKDYFDNPQFPRVFDIVATNEYLLILCESSRGGREILKIMRKNLRKSLNHTTIPREHIEVIFHTKGAPITIKPYQQNYLVIGFLSNEIALFDLTKKAFVYTIQPSLAGFSSLVVNEPYIFSTDESGIVTSINAHNGEILARLEAINKDNNYQIASSSNVILTAGVDKQVGIYYFTPKPSFSLLETNSIKSAFLVYAVGVSSDGKLGAYSKNEANDIGVVDLATLQEIHTLKGSKSLINALIFINHHTLLSSSDDKSFTIWHLP